MIAWKLLAAGAIAPFTGFRWHATLASTVGDGHAAFDAERAWQAPWREERLGLAGQAAPLDAGAPAGLA